MKLKLSLQTKYLILIIGAILAIPFFLTILSMVVFLPFIYVSQDEYGQVYQANELEAMWHEEAKQLEGKGEEEINQTLIHVKDQYKEAGMFWVNQDGVTQELINPFGTIPKKWSASDSISFMKKSFGGDPFTVVAFLSEERNQGFMVFQMPKKYMEPPLVRLRDQYSYIYILTFIGLLSLFLLISWLFFKGIRKRLVRLQEAMSIPIHSSIPSPIKLTKEDEIGRLEESFNKMVGALKESREKEQKELKLRQQLIANLSHDLRTPLTVLRSNLYSLKKEVQSKKSIELVETMDDKISYVADLIENLLSYTLLLSGKYPYEPQQINIVRLVRNHIATWYSVLEDEGFVVDIDLPEKGLFWEIDEKWLKRILDNLLQNVLRHARSGKFVRITISERTLIVEDRGPGMDVATNETKGTGIGLTIISMMTREMNIKWKMESRESGLKMTFQQGEKVF
ncbi:HAMP domain-containing histidine kinase [Bacillus luteolus]|uniref:histidine kinase n=1 Tax=Litchfieldia luteola TaxID=682179 RepID=A0ABR9QGI8_9BACI|nr:HAMP domain-containing sensor histidine kinase [Cytobacillus luteolus]MBE4907596.1 HAMP domain-containing histidine kinase [Cytobacillus luteolus]MBP1944371.1 signal transduction histidine kinase [Cytobacillus luteolus]